MRALFRYLSLFGIGFGVAFIAVAWPQWLIVQKNTQDLADAHIQHTTSHPGWSFPGRVWSASAPIDLPLKERIEQASARGYESACPPAEPGQFCEETGEVVLRGGHFPEGYQPPGNEDWTRPLALEPMLIGSMVGPDTELREHLPLDEAPEHLIAAIMAAEDQTFWEHSGINVKGIIRAVIANLQSGGYQQGASTITMQVARNLTQAKEKTLMRKVKEAAAAIALEQHVGKEGVLQMYLDGPYLGQDGAFSISGFQAAAKFYWGVDARHMSLAQAATLASILPAPARFSPDTHSDEATKRRNMVLKTLAKSGWDVTEALSEPMNATHHDLHLPTLYPAYLQATRQWLVEHVSNEVVYGAGLEVFTAMDVVAQQRTEALIPTRLKYMEGKVGRRGESQLESAAALLDIKTGKLVATWGGTLENETDFNRATQARRQSGSSIKPLVYAMAFSSLDEQGMPVYNAASTVPNMMRTFPGTDGWRPRNVGGEYTETTTLAMGLAWSQNIATASILEKLGGPKSMVAFADRIGFATEDWPLEMGLALGQGEVTPLEMARFAATIIDEGRLASGSPILTAIDAGGNIRIAEETEREAVMTKEAAALTRGLMRLVVLYGTGGSTRGAGGFPGYKGTAMGKTGTTDLEKDLWFIGGTPDYAGAIWIGYDKPTRVGGSASDLAAPLWGWWMHALHEKANKKEFPGLKLKRRAICTESGKWGNGNCKLIGAPFLPGTKPKGVCPIEHFDPNAVIEEPDPSAPPTTETTTTTTTRPKKKKYVGLWRRLEMEEEEKKQAVEAEAVNAQTATESPKETVPDSLSQPPPKPEQQ